MSSQNPAPEQPTCWHKSPLLRKAAEEIYEFVHPGEVVFGSQLRRDSDIRTIELLIRKVVAKVVTNVR